MRRPAPVITVSSLAWVTRCRELSPALFAIARVAASVEKAPLASSVASCAAAMTAATPSARRSGEAAAVAGENPVSASVRPSSA